MVTVIANNKEGSLRPVLTTIARGGGHITESKALRLGEQKVFLAYVWVGDRSAANLLRLNLNDIAEGLTVNCLWIPDLEKEQGIAYTTCKIQATGYQRLGLVHEFHTALGGKGVQVPSMHFQTSTDENERTRFSLDLTLDIPDGVSLEEIEEVLTTTGNTMPEVEFAYTVVK